MIRALWWMVLPVVVIGTVRLLFVTMPPKPDRLALLALLAEMVGAGLLIAGLWTLATNGPRGLVSLLRRRSQPTL